MNHFKLKPTASNTYFGGKSGSGTYQTIINQIPPHDAFISGFLGHCGVMRHKLPAQTNIGFELNTDVIDDWDDDYRLKISKESFLNPPEYLARIIEWMDTFIYLDPSYPKNYISTNRKRYSYTLSDEEHIMLIDKIKRFNCMTAISTYPNPIYEKHLSDWRLLEFKSTTHKGLKTEWLFMNYPEPEELHDYTYLGENYRDRENIKKRSDTIKRKIDKMHFKERAKLFTELQDLYKF